jgi:hypothetical protein
LPERVVGLEAVDLGQADRRQERRYREQVRVGAGHGDSRHGVGGEVEAEEEARVGERGGRDLRLPRDVDAGEPEAGQDADDEEVRELSVPEAQSRRRLLTRASV